VWNHADNAELRKQRTDATLLAEGDVVTVPDPRPKTLNLATATVHRLVVHQTPAALRILLLDIDEEPLASRAYELSFSGITLEGQTDGKGWLEKEIPATQQKITLVLGMGDGKPSKGCRYEWDIHVGHLDPLNEPSGLVQRLANIGYWPTEAGSSEEILPYALCAFQEDHGLEMTGEVDDKTKDKLKEEHGGI
jgi:N-acetylmuramoyl-L-alanine amidase